MPYDLDLRPRRARGCLIADGPLAFLVLLLALAGMLPVAGGAAALPKPSFTIADASLREGLSIAPLATKSGPASSYSKITFTISDGTARAGLDYVRPAPLTVTVGNKALTALGPRIVTLDNARADGPRTVIVTLTAVRNAIIARSSATLTILDDDPPPLPTPTPTAAWVSAPLRGGNVARFKAGAALAAGSRPIDAGELFALYVNGAGWSATMPGDNGQATLAGWSLSRSDSVTLLAGSLEGLAPAPGAPEPVLPAGWFFGILATATQSCANPWPTAHPGVTQNVRYRVAPLTLGGSVMPPNPEAMMAAVPADNPHFGAQSVAKAGCFTVAP